MFHSARLKLTAWYLFIIMLISISFSMAIYRMISSEIDRFARNQRLRIERRLSGADYIPPELRSQIPIPTIPVTDPELAEEAKHRILLILLTIDGGIFFLAGGLGYILAGRTLRPIKTMIDDQNRFISDASHELRTPLTSLKSSMEVNLRDKNLTLAEVKTLLTESIEDVDKLQGLTDGLLLLTQYQKPMTTPKMEVISLVEVIKTAVRKIDPIARTKSITIENNVKDTDIYGNASSLIDLFMILLDNAVKYSTVNQKVSISNKKEDGYMEIQVSDRGIGIAKKDQEHIFERFWRADSAREKTETGGYGLGLSIAKRITDLHHGVISVISTPGKGSTFAVRLPIYQNKSGKKIFSKN